MTPVGTRVGVPELPAAHHSPGGNRPPRTWRTGQDIAGQKGATQPPDRLWVTASHKRAELCSHRDEGLEKESLFNVLDGTWHHGREGNRNHFP